MDSREIHIYHADAGTGKLFPKGTLVYTPTGPVPIEDINTGDKVLSYDGVCKVTAKYHQVDAHIYKITFSDGTNIEACKDHNWWVRNSTVARDRRRWKVLTTQQVLDKGLFRNCGNPRWEIPLCQELQFLPQDVPVKPYTYGALLGDGYVKDKYRVQLTTMDEEILQNIKDEGYAYSRVQTGNSGRASIYTYTSKEISWPQEWRQGSKDKFIADCYKYNTPEIRFSVLKGLCDTDGCVDLTSYRNGSYKCSPSVNYCTISKRLAADVMFLAQSLGGTATISNHKSLYNGEEYQPHYIVRICLPTDYERRLFSIPRKAERILQHTRRILPRRKIVSIEYVGQKEGYCLSVDSKDSTYIVQDCIVTHNTRKLMDIIASHVEAGIPLHRIALVTYTRAAAEVAKQRVCERFGVNIKEAPNFRTIHSMCFQRTGAKANLIMDNSKYLDFGKKAGYEFSAYVGSRDLDSVDWQHLRDDEIVSFEQLYRNHPNKAQWILDNKIDNLDFVRYCQEYVKYKRTFGYVDFTDLLEKYIEDDYFEDVDVACIDEAQDCTPLQWKVLFKAFRKAKYIYIVGDEKQAVYTYNGAEPRILLDMKGVQHTMEKSYRVPRNINEFVKKHIVCDMEDITPTNLLSEHEGGGVKYITTLDELPSINLGKSYLFLCRNRKFFTTWEQWCQRNCIPYSIKNKPLFSNEEKMQFRDGLIQTWEPNRLALAQRYYAKRTFYEQPVVRIDTIHGVKGDEADIVVLLSDISRLTWKELEENPTSEHRVFYVGCTRARETLYIVSPSTKYYYSYLF